MSAVQQASSELATAKTAHASALEALRFAKQEFFEDPTEANRQKVIALERALAEPALLVERAEFQLKRAQQEETEQRATDQRKRLDELNAADAARGVRVSELLMALVAAERSAFGLINELEQSVLEQAREFQERKALALSLGEAMPIRPGKNSTDLRYELQSLIKATQIREGRDGYQNGQVAGWLQPAAFATSLKAARGSA